MQIILLERIQNVGELGDEVRVKSGFARNFLIPKGKAVAATPENREEFEQRREELERQQRAVVDAAQARASQVEGMELTLVRKAGEEGRLFGSVGSADVAEAITEAGVEVVRTEIRLPMDTIRQTGEYEVGVHFHADVDATLKLTIEAEET